MKKKHCKNGHNISLPNSQYPNRNCKACAAERESRPEVKAQRTSHRNSPEAKAKRATRLATPEGKAKRVAYNAKPKAKAKRIAYESIPEVKAKDKRRKLKKIGWTPEMFEQTLLEQGNACALCRKPFTEEDPACADHKHSNPPEPRGLLHSLCNSGIGHFKDNPEALRAAADYAEAWA